MSDPIFTERAELEKWAVSRAKETWPHDKATILRTLEQIKRVTLAHSHLPFKD